MSRRTSRAARSLIWGGIWFLVVGVVILHSPRVPVAAAEQDTVALTEEEVRLFRTSWGIPQDEEEMTTDELLVRMTSADRAWSPAAFELRAKLASPEGLQSLADEFIAYANSIGDSRQRRQLCSDARRVFPDVTAIRVLRETFPGKPTYLELGSWAGVIGGVPKLSPEAAPAAVEFLQELYVKYVENPGNLEAVPGYDRMEPGIIPTLIVEAFGNCGDAGFDALAKRKVSAYLDTTLRAMGRIATERAVQFIIDRYNATDHIGTRLDCLEGLAVRRSSEYPQDIQEFIRAQLPQYLSDADRLRRLQAAEIAGFTQDAAFLPKLEDLAQNDPYSTPGGGTLGGDPYIVRNAAQTAIEKIKTANKLYSKRDLLQLQLEKLQKQLAVYEEDAYGSPHKNDYVQGTQKKIEEVKKELEALGEQ